MLDFVPVEHREAVLANLVRDVRKQGNALTSGDVGHRYFLRALADAGRSDVIFDVHSQSEKPGYGYQLARGATTLTEAWDALPSLSQNHFMLGHIMEWFYRDLAGLAPDPEAPGFKKVIIAPQVVGDVTWAQASYASPSGRFSVSWKKEPDNFHLEVELPPNTSATVSIPATSLEAIHENGRSASTAPGIRFLRQEGNRSIFAIESGQYHFTSTLPVEQRDQSSSESPSAL